MAITTVKTTYSLDAETVCMLERMARRWNVSKSEALRRAIRAAAGHTPPEGEEAIRALDELQEALGLDSQQADEWEKAAREERRASSRRHHPVER